MRRSGRAVASWAVTAAVVLAGVAGMLLVFDWSDGTRSWPAGVIGLVLVVVVGLFLRR